MNLFLSSVIFVVSGVDHLIYHAGVFRFPRSGYDPWVCDLEWVVQGRSLSRQCDVLNVLTALYESWEPS